MAGPAIRAAEPDDVSFLQDVALEHGLDYVVIPNRVLLVSSPGGGAEICLAQGVSPTTTQATAAFVNDQVMMRHVLHASELPLPRWEAGHFVDEPAAITQAAKRIGCPLTLRAGWAGRQAAAFPVCVRVRRPGELDEAVTSLRKAAGTRSSRPTQPRGRFILDGHVADLSLRVLMIGGEVKAVLAEPTGLGGTDVGELMDPATLHADLRTLVLRAVDVLPQIDVASVRIVVRDHTQSPHRQPHAITYLDCYPGLSGFDAAEAGAGRRLALAVLRHLADRAGVTMSRSRSTVSAEFTIDGVDPDSVRGKLARLLKSHRHLQAHGLNPDGSRLRCTLTGDPHQIASLADTLIRGRLARVRPLAVEVRGSN